MEESRSCPDMSKRGACKECGDRRNIEENIIPLPFRLSETENLRIIVVPVAPSEHCRVILIVVSVIIQHNVHRMGKCEPIGLHYLSGRWAARTHHESQ